MLLSEAAILGSTIVRMEAGCWSSCVLGAAATAVGIPDDVNRVDLILDEWPWLEVNEEQYLMEIMLLFDDRVCAGELSLDALIEHIRQIEPPCECGIFSCCCDRVESIMLAGQCDLAAVTIP